MTNKDEMTMNSDKNAYFLSLPEITELSVPPKTILLEEGKVADRYILSATLPSSNNIVLGGSDNSVMCGSERK